MDYEEKEGAKQEYYIPQNYEDAGGVLGGRFTQRNGIEMAVVGVPLVWINLNFIFPYVSLETGIITFLLTVLPPVGLCALGIAGESVSQFLFAIIRFLKRRRFLSFVCFYDGQKKKGLKIPSIQKSFAVTKESDEHDGNEYEDDNSDSWEEEGPREEHTPQKQPRTPKPKKPDQHMHIMNSAMKEILLRKFELNDDDE